MALFDLHQAALLYNLRRFDEEFLRNNSHPPPMFPTTPPQSTKSLPLPTLPPPETPGRRRDPATIVGLTPTARGSSIRRRQDGDTDQAHKYDCADYKEYIREDLSCRVFVDYGVFMKYVLHVPNDWETKWKPAIDAVKADTNFGKHHKKYCGLCDENRTLEKNFYPPLVETANAVLDVVSRSNFNNIPSEKRQYYHINHPNCVSGGVIDKKGLSPDLVLLHEDLPRPGTNKNGSLHWANPLHVLEVKPHGNAICNGRDMPRLVVDGKRARCSLRVWL